MKLIRYEHPQTNARPLSSLFDFGLPAAKRFGGLFDEFCNSENYSDELAADLYEDENNFFVQMEIPGVSKEIINLELENSVLTCSGSYPDETKGKKTNLSFKRAISVPEDVAVDEISASYVDGILTVKMPKSPESKPHQIKIQ